MKKHLQKQTLLLLMAMLCVPWVMQAQTLGDYSFSTGSDATKWVSIPSTTPSLITTAGDGVASSVVNLGFSFPFGEDGYSQFSVNSDGNLRLGGTVTGTGSYSTPFSASNSNTNSPKINFFGCDGYAESVTSHYVRYVDTVDADGDSMGVAEFCMGTYTSSTRSQLYKWQIHMYHNGNIVVVYGPSPATAPGTSRQVGLCVNSSDGWTIDADNVATYFDNGASTTIASGTWPAEGRYYKFVRPIITCPKPISVAISNITANSCHLEWVDTTGSSTWFVYIHSTDDSVNDGIQLTTYEDTLTITTLAPSKQYSIGIRTYCGGNDTSTTRMVKFHTPCTGVPHDSLPYIEGFEDWNVNVSTASDPCWAFGNVGSTSYPYVSSSYHASGTKSLYFYGYNDTYLSYATLPPFEDSLNSLMISFKLYKTSTNYGSIEVGVIENPDDVNTFHSLATYMPEALNTWEPFVHVFSGYHGTGRICLLQRSTYATYLDDIKVETIPSCPNIFNLTFEGAGTTGASATWEYVPGIIEGAPAGYAIEVENMDTTAATLTFATARPSILMTGLTPNTNYKMRVRATCGGGEYGPWDSLSFATSPLPCGEPDTNHVDTTFVGNGANTTYYIPVNNYYKYSYTQQLVLADEMNGPALLSGIDFQYAYSTPNRNKTNCTIYLANTTVSSLSSSFVPYSTDFKPVYTGSLGCVNGWNHFEFDTPFEYTGGNLLVVVHDNSNSYNGTSYTFYTHSASGMARYINNDGSAYDITTVSGGSSYSYRNNMKFTSYGCLHAANCAAPYVRIDTVGINMMEVSWAPGNTETSWNVEYRSEYDTSWTFADTVSTNRYTLNNLIPSTDYQVRITANCSDTALSGLVNCRTLCQPVALPFTEDFETWVTGAGDNAPRCWTKKSTYSDGYPTINTSYSHNGGTKSMYLYSSTNSYSMIVLPAMDAAADSLKVSFWLYSPTASYTHTVEVGVMEDPTDMGTFTTVASVHPVSVSTWEPFEVLLNRYTGNGRYIALKNEIANTGYPYLDDIVVDYISPCERVRNVTSHDETTTTATLSWEATAAPAYEVEYGLHGFARGTGTTVSGIEDTSVTITGLHHSCTYDVYVRGICTPDTGVWSFCYTFNAACGLIDSLPFFQDFDNIGTSSTIHAPVCWIGHSSYSANYPSLNTSYSRSGSGASMYMYHSNNGTNYTMLQLPQVDVTEIPMNTIQVEFSLMNNYNRYTHGIILGICSAPGADGISTFEPIDTVVCGYTQYVWEDFEIPLNYYQGTGSFITFMSYAGTSSSCYPYLDNVRLVSVPACQRPDEIHASAFGTSDATLQWTLRDSTQSNFEIRYGHAGCNIDTLTGITINGTNTAYLTGLDSGVVYDVWVRAICGTEDTSVWTAGQFSTLGHAPVRSYPYTCDFTGYEGQAWNLVNGTQTNKWYVGSAAFFGTADSMGLYISDNNGVSNTFNTSSASITYAYRTFVMPAGQFTYSFDWRAYGQQNRYYDWLRVFLVPVDEQLVAGQTPRHNTTTYDFAQEQLLPGWMDLSQVTTEPYTLNQQSNFTNLNGTFEVPAGTYNLVFAWANDEAYGTNPPAAIDNVMIAYNACPAPANFRTTGNTSTTVSVAWDGNGYEGTAYDLSIDTIVGSPAVDTSIVGNSCTFTGLTTGTTYYIYVRSHCSDSDTSAWIGPLTCTPGVWLMRPNMTDTVQVCGGTIYDDGGPLDPYGTGSQNSTIVIMPDDANHVVSVSGTSYTESTYDYITIYDGIGTTGTVLWTDYGIYSRTNFGPFISTTGPVTVTFHTDGSGTFEGFHIDVDCILASCNVEEIRLDPSVPLVDDHLNVIWNPNGADYCEVEYGETGFTQGTGTLLTTNTNSITIPGLDILTYYDVYVRSICNGGADTGAWIDATFRTGLCANVTEGYSYDASMPDTTNRYSPIGYTFYNYSYVQTLIDSAQMAGLTDPISAFAFNPTNTISGEYYFTHCDVYMANVPEDDLSAGVIQPDINHQFVEVLHDANLKFTETGWQIHGFDNVFLWDGHSNVVFAVNRRNGLYNSSTYFASHVTPNIRTRCLYHDSIPFSYTNPTSTHYDAGYYVGDIKFFACPGAGCRQPVVTDVTKDHESITINWTGEGTDYEINIKESAADNWTTPDIAVTGNTYTFNGLQPATNYQIRLRQNCTADNLGYSLWSTTSVMTDSLPCFAPTNVVVSDVTNANATIDWTARGTESAWDVHVWFSGSLDTIYTVTAHPATVGGLTANITYNVAVRALCGSTQNVEGEWSDTTTFTTIACPNVTGLAASDVTASTVTLNWNSDPMAQSWIIEYGFAGFTQGQGTTVNANTNSYVVTDLMDETAYEFYVKAVCDVNWNSEAWSSTSATTLGGGGEEETATLTVTVNGNGYVLINDQQTLVYNGLIGDQVDLSAVADENNHFVSWSDGNTDADRTLILTQPSTTLTATFAETQGIEDVNGVSCIISPNPTSHATTVSVCGVNGKVRIAIVDMNGREVTSETIECAADCKKTMNVEGLAQGAYFVRITGETVSMVKKLIVR